MELLQFELLWSLVFISFHLLIITLLTPANTAIFCVSLNRQKAESEKEKILSLKWT